MNLSIVIPCYNEEQNIPSLVARLRAALGGNAGAREDVEVVLVNNGSTDRSADVLAAELAGTEAGTERRDTFRVVTVPKNLGYGHGIMEGLRSARGEYLAWTHADLQTDPGDVLAGFERLLQEADPRHCLLRGRRTGRKRLDALFTFGMSVFAWLNLRTWLSDINAQPKIFHREFLTRLTEAPDDFSLDLYVLFTAKKAGYTLLGLPVEFGKRTAGEAKGGGSLRGKVRLTKRTVRFILDLKGRLRRTKRDLHKGPQPDRTLPAPAEQSRLV